jgi:hypothetical protein
MTENKTVALPANDVRNERPAYERPRMQMMTERELLNTFQLTHSMAGWWTTLGC